MKLQPKHILNNQAELERKKQIDEGLSLAKKVDALREEKNILETQRTKRIEQFHVELDSEISEKQTIVESLRSEVRILENRKSEAKKPLDEEWGKLTDDMNKHEELKEN